MRAPPPAGELVALLRKAHPDELVPLADLLGVPLDGVDLGVALREIDRRLRRLSSNGAIDALTRRGRIPSYAEVLSRVGRRLGLAIPEAIDLAELAIARHELRRSWAGLTPEQRRARWSRVEDPLIPPDQADALEALLARRHPRSFGYFLLRLVEEPVFPLPGCLFLLWLGRPRMDLVVPAVLAVGRLRQTVRHRVTIGIIGSPSSGKDAALAAVFGIVTGNVSAVAGSTTEVEIRKLEGKTALHVVNTPGLGDVVTRLTAEAKRIFEHIDLFLYILNAQGGVQVREATDHAACAALGRPVLVIVNKLDTLREEDRTRMIDDCRTKLGITNDAIVGVAFDPLPGLVDGPIGVAAVRRWIERQLVLLGKDPDELPWATFSL